MANNETNGTDRKLGLKKKQIIRGFDAYKKVLSNSRIFSTDLLLAYLNKEDLKDLQTKNKVSSSPAHNGLTELVKVGFIISKKKVKKANKRNYGKRLMKEAFRLNGDFFLTIPEPAV